MVMNNQQVAGILSRIADILDIQGETPFKGVAYRKAADQIANLGTDISEIMRRGELRTIPGVGEALEKKLAELLATGHLRYYEDLLKQVPPGVVELLEIPDVGPKTARLLWDKLGITSIAEAEQAARAGTIRGLPGMGARSEQKILEGIEVLRRRSGRISLGVAWPVADELLAEIRRAPGVLQASAAGSLRRRQSTIGDIDLLAAAHNAAPTMKVFAGLQQVERVLLSGPTKTTVRLRNGLNVDLRVLPPERWGSLLQYSTGSKAHNVRLREFALTEGLSLSEYGYKREGREILCPREEDVYETLGLPWIPPELREDRGEIAAAMEGRLPTLVELSDLKGDLHVHTNSSDGKRSIEEMAEAAHRRGHKYIVISDHTKGLGIAHGLTPERFAEQAVEVERLNRKWKDFRLLHGAEVDIRGDGSLDLPEELMARMDIVVASVHSGLRQARDQITARIEAAMRNPHVDIVGHPSGRLLGVREGSDVDLDRLLAVAAETGTALEVNSTPQRLDLDDVHIRQAVGMRIKIAIDSDAHSIDMLDLLVFGVATARRGWAEARDVLNTRPAEELLAHRKGRQAGSGSGHGKVSG